jgi:site-specific recombinase XerD
MNTQLPDNPQFHKFYLKHTKHLKLVEYQPKTIEAYSRAIKRIGNYFACELDNLSQDQLLDYFHDLLETHSWGTVKLDLYGLQFFYTHVLNKTWEQIPLIKKPKATRIPDILSIKEVNQLIAAKKRKKRGMEFPF